MNIDDFLSENGFDLSEEQESSDCQSEAGALSPRSMASDMETEMVQERPEVPYKKMKRVESSASSTQR